MRRDLSKAIHLNKIRDITDTLWVLTGKTTLSNAETLRNRPPMPALSVARRATLTLRTSVLRSRIVEGKLIRWRERTNKQRQGRQSEGLALDSRHYSMPIRRD